MLPQRHLDILDQPESLKKPLLGSVVLHLGCAATLVLTGYVAGKTESWGDINAGGGAGSIAINVVNRVPLPSRAGLVNPLANDSQFTVPSPPPQAKAQQKVPEPEPDAIPIKSRNAAKKPSPVQASRDNYNPLRDRPENQVYSRAGQALVSPLIGQTGGGGVGLGPHGSPFGDRYGNYVAILRQKVAQNWHTADVDPRLKTAPPVIVTFVIMKNGSVENIQIAQRSGNTALDYSAQRAIYDSSPFPPLPAGYAGSSARIEIWFQLSR